MDVNEHKRLSNITRRHKLNVKEQLVVRKDMGVNEHERLSNITLRHNIKQRNNVFIAELHVYTETKFKNLAYCIYYSKLILLEFT